MYKLIGMCRFFNLRSCNKCVIFYSVNAMIRCVVFNDKVLVL
jgi:hypothetical protein